MLDPDACGGFAEELGIDDASIAALARDERVQAAIAAAIEEANAHLSRVEQIKRFASCSSEWMPGGDELTPTMKLKRADRRRSTPRDRGAALPSRAGERWTHATYLRTRRTRHALSCA